MKQQQVKETIKTTTTNSRLKILTVLQSRNTGSEGEPVIQKQSDKCQTSLHELTLTQLTLPVVHCPLYPVFISFLCSSEFTAHHS